MSVFAEVKRVLRDDGTLWVNIADSYAGSGKGSATHAENAAKWKQGTNRGMVGKGAVTKTTGGGAKSKDLIGIPWLLAFALREAGWYWREKTDSQYPNVAPQVDLYAILARVSCWCCRNKNLTELKAIYYHFTNSYWAKLKAIQMRMPTGYPMKPSGTVMELEARFKRKIEQEERQCSILDYENK